MTNKFAFYIHADMIQIDNFEKINFEEYKKNSISLIEIGRQLKADIYYSGEEVENVNNIKSSMAEFDEYIKSEKSFLATLLSGAINNTERNHYFKVSFSHEASFIEYFDIKSLHSICTKKEINIVLSLGSNLSESLLLINPNNEFKGVNIKSFCSKEEIWKFINQNLPLRKYNFSSKHGNINNKANAPKSNEKASQLSCSDKEAQILLDNAIFDLRKHNWCYNFDENLDTFIIFPFEGINPQNQYHAYHIEKSEWMKEIPESIRKYFNK
jgi:hypothetical protein